VTRWAPSSAFPPRYALALQTSSGRFTGERETAALYYRVLKQVAPKHPTTEQAERTLYTPFWIRLLRKWAARLAIEFCISNRAIAHVCPLTFILSPSGGEGRVRGMVAHNFYWQCKTQ
jgi:hypothetical protein